MEKQYVPAETLLMRARKVQRGNLSFRLTEKRVSLLRGVDLLIAIFMDVTACVALLVGLLSI